MSRVPRRSGDCGPCRLPLGHTVMTFTYSVTGFYPILLKEENKMIGKFTLKVKDGDYVFDSKTGRYGAADLVTESEDLVKVLRLFLDHVEDAQMDGDDLETKISLTFRVKGKVTKS